MIPAAQHVRHPPSAPLLRPRVVRPVEQRPVGAERFLLRRLRVPEDSRQQPDRRVDDPQRRELAARQHVVPDRQLLVNRLVDQPLVDAFVAPCQPQEPRQRRQPPGGGLVERPTLRGQVDPGTAGGEPVAGGGNRRRHRLDLQHHPRAAAVRAVIDRPVHVLRILARILGTDPDQTALDRAPDHSDRELVQDGVRKQRHHLHREPRPRRVHRPRSPDPSPPSPAGRRGRRASGAAARAGPTARARRHAGP